MTTLDALFRSFFIAGIECSTHRLRSGRRLDVIAATGHDRHFREDYRRFQEQGIYTARSGLRWHLIEPQPGRYDFSSVLPMLRSARDMKMQIIWDLHHYGTPDDIDIFKPHYIDRFARMAGEFAHVVANETDETLFICPVNEISFLSWGGGDVAYMNPFAHGRGFELKVQLARAAIAATEAVWAVLPNSRIVHVDPVINIIARPDHPEDAAAAEGHRVAQYQGWDLISGRIWPQAGGDPKYLDILGLNYYHNNQWQIHGPTMDRFHPLYRPLYHILREVSERYNRPIFIAETGIENEVRPDWLRYVMGDVQRALQHGVNVEGVCLYPILNHPGWDDDRHCYNGLWDYCNEDGSREIYAPLADELQRQRIAIAQTRQVYEQRVKDHEVRLWLGQEKPHICLFTDSLEPSGMGEHMLLLAAELCDDFRLTLICPPSKQGKALLRRARALGIATLALEVRGQNRISWERLRDFLDEQQVDVLHIHAGIGWEGHHAVYAAHAGHPQVVIRTEHLPYLITDVNEQHNYFTMLRYVDQVIVVSQASYESYLEAGVSAEKLRVLPNGITATHRSIVTVDLHQLLGLSERARLLLTTARLTEQKGHADLLQAVPKIVRQHPDAHFVWIGDGPLRADLRKAIRINEVLRQHVHLLGHQENARALLHQAEAFVLPSHFEGMPIVLLEAMAAGIPIVATAVSGVRELIAEESQGWLVDARDPVALAAAVTTLLDDMATASHKAQAAKDRFQQHFQGVQMAAKTAQIYRQQLQLEREMQFS